MTKKADFRPEAWITLRAVFDAILLNVAVADQEMDDAEAKAWRGEIDALAHTGTPLVRALLAEAFDAERDPADQAVVDKAANTPFDVLVQEAGAILKAKATPEEIADYQRSARSLAVAVAEGATGGDAPENRRLAHLNDLLAQW